MGPAGSSDSGEPQTAPGATSGTTASDGDGSDDESGRGSDDETDGGDSTGRDVTDNPTFVALGHGGWFATSCDLGRTWQTQAFSDVADDHSPWSGFGGLAFGDGVFVGGFGWGALGHVTVSSNGSMWTDLDSTAFPHDKGMGYDSWTAGVVHDGEGFLLFAQDRWTSSTGDAWTIIDGTLPPGTDQIRQVRAFDDGLIVIAAESQSGGGHPVGNFMITSQDRGVSWSEGTGFVSECADGVQHYGDIERSGDTLLVGANSLCRSNDLGATWSLVDGPGDGSAIGDLVADQQGFLAFVGQQTWRSADGSTWSQETTVAQDVQLGYAAYGAETYVVVDRQGTRFFYSDDGLAWSPATVESGTNLETWVRDVAFGYAMGTCGA